ncbi:MAG: riboflavin biosynthesis protein RibF [Proteobacteria bacterium]|nr:riboflavin biosynthesis protein RibF [Pseudomonadota bacterium]
MTTSSVLTIGNFDGIHIGHRHLIETTIALARASGAEAILLTFSPHPRQFIAPCRHFFIVPETEKHHILGNLGLDAVIYLDFAVMKSLSPGDFLTKAILPLSPCAIVLGENYIFGHNRSGDISTLRSLCLPYGISVHSLSMQPWGGGAVSSTRIRQAILQGDMASAAAMLGRPYTMRGIVERGAGRGHTLGFATANIRASDQVLPPLGVYATYARVGETATRLPAVTAVTRTPTFQAVDAVVETHILDYDQSIYGQTISVEFISKLRDETTFSSKDALIEQIRTDCCLARAVLSG